MIETARLLIIPLDHRQLSLYLEADGKFEIEFGLSLTGRRADPGVKERVIEFILPRITLATGDSYLFYTFWIVIERSTQRIVAELGFKGEPNDRGEIEIGYGTMPGYRSKGLMTEAVGAVVDWAKKRNDVKYILAETDEDNTASIRVVQKNWFTHFNTKGKMLWWKIAVK